MGGGGGGGSGFSNLFASFKIFFLGPNLVIPILTKSASVSRGKHSKSISSLINNGAYFPIPNETSQFVISTKLEKLGSECKSKKNLLHHYDCTFVHMI